MVAVAGRAARASGLGMEPDDEEARVAQGCTAGRVVDDAGRGTDDRRARTRAGRRGDGGLRARGAGRCRRAPRGRGRAGPVSRSMSASESRRGTAERGGQRLPDRGLATPHQPDQHDVPHPRSVPPRRRSRAAAVAEMTESRPNGRGPRQFRRKWRPAVLIRGRVGTHTGGLSRADGLRTPPRAGHRR